MEKNIQYTIAGINYVLIEHPINNEYRRRQITERMLRHGGIFQSAEIKKPSFWSSSYVLCRVLIPENKLSAYNLEGMK